MIHETTREFTAHGPEPRVTDISGYTVFSHGDAGAAHVMAHEMLDRGQIELGHERLAAWLDGRSGSGSDWAHLQFHMAIFELGVGDWCAAHERFITEILPIAATTEDALTDAPALLWRLAMTAPEPIELPWAVLRRTALRRMRRPSEAFVEMHHLLALAGAGDRRRIDAWLRARYDRIYPGRERLVIRAGAALRAYLDGRYDTAAVELQRLAPQMSDVGGSRAQNELFEDLASHCAARARESGLSIPYAVAA